jgi:hypothetical protein
MNDLCVVLVKEDHPSSYINHYLLSLFHRQLHLPVFVKEVEKCATLAVFSHKDKMSFLIADANKGDKVRVRSYSEHNCKLSLELLHELLVNINL